MGGRAKYIHGYKPKNRDAGAQPMGGGDNTALTCSRACWVATQQLGGNTSTLRQF